MRHDHRLGKAALAAAFVLLLAGSTVRAQDIGYDGNFTLSPVGDLDMVLKLTLPMEKYQSLRNSVSNLSVFLRDLASTRAGAEVAERNAEWNDSARTLTFTIEDRDLRHAEAVLRRSEEPAPHPRDRPVGSRSGRLRRLVRRRPQDPASAAV